MSLRFDVSGDTLTRTTNLPGITAFTLMAWVYRVGAANTQYDAVFGIGNGTSQYALYISTSGVVRFALTDWATDFNGSAITNATWYHLAIVCNGTGAGNLLGYRNGTLEITGNGTAITAAQLQMSGGPAGVSEFINARIGGVKLYSAALNATEIATEAANWLPQRTANLNGWYPMTDASVANCLLSATPGPTGNNWTAGGTLTIEADPPAATPSAAWEQEGYRWRNDDGSETTATYIAAQDTPL